MDNLTLYNYITEAQEALVKYWGEDGKKVIAQCFQERALGEILQLSSSSAQRMAETGVECF